MEEDSEDLEVSAGLLVAETSLIEELEEHLANGLLGDYAEPTLSDYLLRSIPQFEKYAKNMVFEGKLFEGQNNRHGSIKE